MKKNKCIFCEIKHNPTSSYPTSYVRHHVEWGKVDEWGNKIGKVITLCKGHHGQLHTYLNEKARKTCLEFNSNFYHEATDEYMEKLKDFKTKLFPKA